MKKIKNWTKWMYWFTFAVAVIFVYKTLDSFSDIAIWFNRFLSILMPFLIGALLAYLFYKPARGIENIYKKMKLFKKHSRGFSVLTTYIIALLLIILFINIVFPAISESVVDLANNLPTYYNRAIEVVDNMPEDGLIQRESVQEIISNLQKIDIAKIFSMENISGYINGVIGIASGLFSTFVAIVISIYILLERDQILEFSRKIGKVIFKNKTNDQVSKYIAKTNEIFFKFISTQILDGIIVGIIVSIAMWIMGVKYGVFLGFFIGIANIIPYFGSIVAIIVATLITVFTGGVSQALWMVVVVTILQQIDANIINPRILGNALKLSPILVIFSITLFGAYFGFIGMLLAVPIMAILKIIVNDYLEYKIKLKEKDLKIDN